MSNPIIHAENLSKCYHLYRKPIQRLTSWLTFGKMGRHEDIWALRDLNLTIHPGETVGVIGVNGAGKSTLLKLISGTTFPTTGSLDVYGRATALLELGAGFHPEFTGRENIRLNGALLGFSNREIREREDEIIEFSGLGDFADRPVKTYSSGMVVRLGFSVASHLDPDILLVDEVLAVGDEAFRIKCLERFNTFRESGKTLVFVSHDLRLIRLLCRRVILLDKGRMVGDGEVESVVLQYLKMIETPAITAGSAVSDIFGEAAHRGSGEIRIEKVILASGDGQATNQFLTGEPFEVRIQYQAKDQVKIPIFMFHILTRDGTLCLEALASEGKQSDTARMGREKLKENALPVAIGETGEWVFRTPELQLLGGEYYLNVYIYDMNQLVPLAIDEISRAVKFTVSGGMVASAGLFHHPGEWKRLKAP